MAKALLYELGKSTSFGRLPLLAKVLWPMILSSSDDQGRGLAETDVIKWNVCPNVEELTAEVIPAALKAMEAQGMLHLYHGGRGRHLYQIIRWWEYQQLSWAQPSRYDAPEGWTDRIRCQRKGGDSQVNWDKPGGFVDNQPPEGTPLPSDYVEPTSTLPSGSTQLNSTQLNTESTADADRPPATFQEWQTLVRESDNRPATLLTMYQTLYPGRDPPTFAYIGKAARKVGGAGRLADLLWQHSTRPPTGDVLAYMMGHAKREASDDAWKDAWAHILAEMKRVSRRQKPNLDTITAQAIKKMGMTFNNLRDIREDDTWTMYRFRDAYGSVT